MELTIFQMVGPAASVTKVTKSVIKYVEGDGFERDLASIQTKAAKSAFEKSVAARNKKAQIWAVVNHLETAEIALQDLLESQAKHILTPLLWMQDLSELFNIRIFMTSCYIYLKEYELGLEMLFQAENCIKLFKSGYKTLFVPTAYLNLAYYIGRDYIQDSYDLREMYIYEDIQNKLEPTIQNLRKVIYSKKFSKKKFSKIVNSQKVQVK